MQVRSVFPDFLQKQPLVVFKAVAPHPPLTLFSPPSHVGGTHNTYLGPLCDHRMGKLDHEWGIIAMNGQ